MSTPKVPWSHNAPRDVDGCPTSLGIEIFDADGNRVAWIDCHTDSTVGRERAQLIVDAVNDRYCGCGRRKSSGNCKVCDNDE